MKPKRRYLLETVLFLTMTAGTSGLTVTLDNDYPPYCFAGPEGVSQGILVDLWKLWSEKTGEPVTLSPLPWSEALKAKDEGRADVLDTVFATPSRREKLLFTDPYARIRTAIFHRDGMTSLQSLEDLKGYLIGIKAGDTSADALRGAGISGLKEYPSYGAIIDAAAAGSIHVFCMDIPPALHLLYSKHLSAQFRQGLVLAEDGFRRAVDKRNPELLVKVDRGFSLISPQEFQDIQDRWQGVALENAPASLVISAWIIGSLVLFLLLTTSIILLRRRMRGQVGQLQGTEEKLNTALLHNRALLQAMPDLLFVLDRTGLIAETLAPVRNELYHNPERFVGKTILEVFGPAVWTEAATKMEEVQANGGVARVEASLEMRGETRAFEARIAAMADGAFLAIVRDVSDRRRAWEDDLHQNKLESLGVMAGGLAHDFNNSLAVIQGFVSLARLQLSQPIKALASLDKAVAATRRAAGLTSQLRVLAHGNEVHRQLLSLRVLAEEAASFALVGSPCVLVVEAGDGPWTVEADPDQLSQVFHNLVLNAVQAMPAGGTVTLVFQKTRTDKISVSVVDEGAGIPSSILARVFDPYFTTKARGTGLGLSVVHAVIQRHGGTLEVESREGRGTVFTVNLPVAMGTIVAPSPTPVPNLEALRGLRVLLMEDEPELRELMVQVCQSLELVPVACRTGSEGITAFDAAIEAATPFSLVISDLLVPGEMGGREMIAHLRKRPQPFRAIAVTGFSTERSAEDFHSLGFDVIVGKPFTVEELKAHIVGILKEPWKTASTN